jgi:hypothetical protein
MGCWCPGQPPGEWIVPGTMIFKWGAGTPVRGPQDDHAALTGLADASPSAAG